MISVIMPVYNVEKTLVRAVESVLNQTYRDFELLLVNDGSTDSSKSICDTLASTDDRITVIDKENGGLSSARNAGLDQASGKYVAFIDSDDYFDTNLLMHFVREKETDTEVFVFNVRRINEKKINELPSINETVQAPTKAIQNMFKFKGIDFYAWNKIYLRTLFQGVRYPEGHLYEDIVPTYQVTKKAKQIQFSTFIGYNYIDNNMSIVNSKFNSSQYDNVWQRMILLKLIEDEYPALVGEAIEKLVDGFLSTGYKMSQSKRTKDTELYYSKLKKDIIKSSSIIRSRNSIPKSKQLALKLLMFNLSLYGKLYKTYLGK